METWEKTALWQDDVPKPTYLNSSSYLNSNCLNQFNGNHFNGYFSG